MTAEREGAKAIQRTRNHTIFAVMLPENRFNDKPSARVRLLGMKKVANSV